MTAKGSRGRRRKVRARRSVSLPAPDGNHPGDVRRHRLRGLYFMVAAAGLFAVMSLGVYSAGHVVPPVPASTVSFIRVLVNMLILWIPATIAGKPLSLFGDLRPSLWLRGLFGGTSLMLSFAAIQRIGPGESAFLTATSGVFVAVMGPAVLGQRNSLAIWLAILGALGGVYLLAEPRAGHGDLFGRAAGLAAGFLAALAYLMVARAGRSNSPECVVFYFCLVAAFIHLAYFTWAGWDWPNPGAWGWVLLAGLSGSGAQWFMTRAYQLAPAAEVSAVGYLSPVLSLIFGAWLFGAMPDVRGLAGCGLVLGCGVLIPFLTASRRLKT